MKTITVTDDTFERICDCFAVRMLELREQKGEVQWEFGVRVGVSQSSIARYERGLCLPRARKLCHISTTLSVSFDWLLGFSDERSIPLRVTKARA